ncbi:MAG: hypothetical protein R2731_14475 [Nocardioides sp.]
MATTTEMLKRTIIKGQAATRIIGPYGGAATQLIVDLDRDDLSMRQRLTRPVMQAAIAGGSDAAGALVATGVCGVTAVPTAGGGCFLGAVAGFGATTGTSFIANEALDLGTDHIGAVRWLYGDWYDD